MFVLRRYFGAERRRKGQKKGRGRHPSSQYDYSFDNTDYAGLELAQEKPTPVQNVYFFQKGIRYQTRVEEI